MQVTFKKHYFIKIRFTLAYHLLRSLPRVFHSNIPIKKFVAISFSHVYYQKKHFYFTKIVSLRVKKFTNLPEVKKSPIKIEVKLFQTSTKRILDSTRIDYNRNLKFVYRIFINYFAQYTVKWHPNQLT